MGKNKARKSRSRKEEFGNVTGVPGDRPGRSRTWAWLSAGAVSLALVVFSRALAGTFVFDDVHLPFADPRAAVQPVSFWIGGVRPVVTATYWLNFLMSGTRPLAYHVTNVLFHAMNGFLVFLIFGRLLDIARISCNRQSFALFGAALFLIHPLQTEPVDYIAGRSELVAGFFFCAAWLVFLRGFEERTGPGRTVVIFVLGTLAVLGKESAISLPLIFLLCDFYFSGRPLREQIGRRIPLYTAVLVGGVAGSLAVIHGLTKDSGAGFSVGVAPFSYALTQCRVILIYLRLFLFPIGQNGDWQLPFYRSFADAAAIFSAAGLLLLIVAAIRLYRWDRLVSFGLVSFLLMLGPTSSIIPLKDALAERRMYLPVVGLILALVAAAARIRLNPQVRRATAITVLGICALLSYWRSSAWASDFDMWNASVRANPDNARAHLGLGSAMLLRHDCAGAVREFAMLHSRDKTDLAVLWDLAEAYQCAKQPRQSLAVYREYASAHATPAAYVQIGLVEGSMGDSEGALSALGEALRLDPGYAPAYAYRGTARLALGSAMAAKEDFVSALRLDSGNQIAAAGMADLAAQHQ